MSQEKLMKEETELSTRIEVQNLVVNPRSKREIAIGDADSFLRVTKDTHGICAILWNEEGITLMTQDYSTIITFKPELNPSVTMFFQRSSKRENEDLWGRQTGLRVWEGDYEPVKFTKAYLLKFLKQYTLRENTKLVEAVKEMKISERHIRTETMIDLADDNNFQATEEQVLQTNIPTKFTLDVSLLETPLEQTYVSLDFEAKVVQNEDRYSQEKGKKLIQINCTNARTVLRKIMEDYVARLPKTIPRYYGRLSLESLERGR